VRVSILCFLAVTALIFLPRNDAAAAAIVRTTLVVSDIEKSIQFYERLGLVKVTDEARTGVDAVHGLEDLPLTADPSRSRLVVLRGEGQGAEIALLWYDRPPLASARGNLMGVGTGDVILGFTVPDLQAAYGALDRLGARVSRPPNRLTAGGAPAGLRLYAYDPDGHMVEIIQSGGP
jgi:catechol 2,3-dioxygenase-like lactoylglutathione lyase family enzyme